MVELADILRRHWPAYVRRWGHRLSPEHHRAVRAILRCRTPQLGGQLYRCPGCGQAHYAYHSCGHRACPKCGHHDAGQWLARQQNRLLPVPYFLVTFTVPPALAAFLRSSPKAGYAQLFAQSAGALQDVAATRLGIEPGFLGILQTWTRDLRFHPHVHYLVPGGGLTRQGRWRSVPDAGFFLPQRVLAARFRTRFKRWLQQTQPERFVRLPGRIWRQDWVVDVLAVGGGEAALKYLSAYIYKTAITSSRLLAFDDSSVTFSHRDRESGHWLSTRLPAETFLHRFLQHLLPRGFQRVRSFGWLAPAAMKRWRQVLRRLRMRPRPIPAPIPLAPPECPHCQCPMLLIGRLARALP